MHGQFKSRTQCPKCDVISTCFDPFMMCSLPTPSMMLEKITFYYLFYDNREKALKINFKYQLSAEQTAKEFK
jgi:ubiquitin carboxyl-terminal hydrolase 4/11